MSLKMRLGKGSDIRFMLFRLDQSLSNFPGGRLSEAVRNFNAEEADLND